MMLTLALLAAQDTSPDDPAIGDRIEITFHSGSTIVGTLVAPPAKAEKGSLTLDVTLEYPELNGTMTVPKKEIKGVRKLRGLDPETKKKLAEMKKRIAEENAKTPPPKPKPAATPEPKPEPPVEEPKPKPEEELKKAREFYEKFPAPDWSEERYNAIRLKKLRGQLPTPTEREFEAGFELWKKGRPAPEKKPTPQ